MFNPCYLFTPDLLESMIQKEVVHFVRSAYKRGTDKNDETIKNVFLISHYHDPAEAERHYNAIIKDRYRFLYDARNKKHLEKLQAAALQPAGYKIYSQILLPGIEKRITTIYREHTKRYIFRHTNWKLKGKMTLFPHLYFQLGELYVRIAHEGDEIKIKFEEIENA